MSYRKERFLQYKESGKLSPTNYLENLSKDEVYNLFHEILLNGVFGFCMSLYEEGQQPGDVISAEQIRRRLSILKPYSQWVRSFSTTEGNELVPEIAKEMGMKTLVGAWLGSDKEKNDIEIENLIKLAKAGFVDVAAVGNEVLYRHDLTEEELLGYINYVKEQIPGIPVGYVDAYYEFSIKPAITEACDVLLCNCYPYWEGTSFEDSLNHMRGMYNQVKSVANGKRVMITETGWPSQGESLGGAIPNKENAMRYFIKTQLWAQDDDVEVFYFSSFDESWKKGAEGEVGAYWGIWDHEGKLKY